MNFIILITAIFSSWGEVHFCAVGDVLLDRGIRRAINKYGINYPFEGISDYVKKQDLAFCNLECPVSPGGSPLKKLYCFHADTSFLEGLRYAGFNIASIANNHSLDWGRTAFLETKEILEKNYIYAVGGGKNQEEANKPRIVECNGLRFAFFGYLNLPPEAIPYRQDKPGPAFGKMGRIINELTNIRESVDFIIVSFHWGKEYDSIPNSMQKTFARKVVDAGADLVIGHHPHVLQSMENYKGKFIVYSLGNFIFDQHGKNERSSMIFGCKFRKGRIDSVYFLPVFINNYSPEFSSTPDIKNYISRISKNSNIRFTEASDNKVLLSDTSTAVFNTPIVRAEFAGRKLYVFRENLVLTDSADNVIHSGTIDSNATDSFYNAERYEFKDCCIVKDSTGAVVYGIMGKVTKSTGEHIVIFPVTRDSILGPLIDMHKFDLWKLIISDVDGDGNSELCVGLKKKTRYDTSYANRLFIYNRSKFSIYPKWLGSKLLKPFIDFDFYDTDGDGINELVALEFQGDSTKRITAYKWRKFGFVGFKILDKNLKDTRRWDTKEFLNGSM